MSEQCDHPSSDGYWGYPDGVFKCTVCGQLHTDVPVGPDTSIVRTVNVVITDAERVPTDDELAAIRAIVADDGVPAESVEWFAAFDTLRAYLERQR